MFQPTHSQCLLSCVFFPNLTFNFLAGAKNGQKFLARENEMVDIHQPIDNRKSTYALHPNHECHHQRRRAAVQATINRRMTMTMEGRANEVRGEVEDGGGGVGGGGATDDKIIALASPVKKNNNQPRWGLGSDNIALAMATPPPPMTTTLRGKVFGDNENNGDDEIIALAPPPNKNLIK